MIKQLRSLVHLARRRRCPVIRIAHQLRIASLGPNFEGYPAQYVRSATLCEASTPCRTYVRPWKNGWLRFNTRDGLKQWWSSLGTQVESVRISAGMIVVISRVKNIWNESYTSLSYFPASSSGFRLANDKSSSVFWLMRPFNCLGISSYKSVIHSLGNLDDGAVAVSPTLRALRAECRRRSGQSE